MPHIPIAHERVLAETEEITLGEYEVELYTYAEEYRHQWATLRGLLGFSKNYTRRHIRAEAPEFYHSRADPDSTCYENQRKELLDEVWSAKQRKEDFAAEVR